MDAKLQLDKLFNLDFIDLEKSFYQTQKSALQKGILFSPTNGQLINYQKSNKLISDETKATNYVLIHAFYVSKIPALRGKLSKLVVFPEDELLITFYHQNQIIKELFYSFNDEEDFKITGQNLFSLCDEGYDPKNLQVEVKLTKESRFRLEAEHNDHIFESELAWQQMQNEMIQKMEVLMLLNKVGVFNERLKLWGFSSGSKESIHQLFPLTLEHKDLFILSQINYRFLQELTNQELLVAHKFDLNYLRKAKLLSGKLTQKEILWISQD